MKLVISGLLHWAYTLLCSSEVCVAETRIAGNGEAPHGLGQLLGAEERLAEPLHLSTIADLAMLGARWNVALLPRCEGEGIREQAHGLAVQQD
jgi:hypothetical protein